MMRKKWAAHIPDSRWHFLFLISIKWPAKAHHYRRIYSYDREHVQQRRAFLRFPLFIGASSTGQYGFRSVVL
jgi:hypothetical protein